MSFIEQRVRNIKAMNATLKEYQHPASGARHIHLETDDPEMVFLVAFPTVPDKSDGRAHILEHLALCGSARYPVRDPFFSMLRRSTATYMNAMTYPDRTVYPFASTSDADFFNLLGVYLDAAFFPRLDYLDFLQEGWRHTLEEGKLGYGGVVFNEMKGAFADPMRALAQGMDTVLFSGTTYEVESGGDPLHIPSLGHQDLIEFHASHYHPSQAIFMTSGRIDPARVQEVINEHVLNKLDGFAPRRMPELASYWDRPREQQLHLPSPTARQDEHGIQLAWLLEESSDAFAYYSAHLLESGLVGDSSAPLMQAMESAGYGRPSAFNGLDSGHRQMVFHLGMEGLTMEQTTLARNRIWEALERTAEEGVPQEVLQAALRNLRFHQREIQGGHLPYGMRKLLQALPFEMAGGDVMAAFDSEPAFERLEAEIRDPAFFTSMVRRLLEAPTLLTTTTIPDARYFEARQEIENQRLAERERALTMEERERIAADAATLLARQRQPANNALLPRIRPEDVSPAPRPLYALPQADGTRLALAIASNGVCYGRVVYDLSALPASDWPWLDLYAALLPDLGVGDRDFAAAAAWRQQLAPTFAVDLDAQERVAPEGESPALLIRLSFASKNVREEAQGIAALLSESVRAPRFDEDERISFLIDSIVQNQAQSIAEHGDQYAAITAELPLSPRKRFQNAVEGVDALRFYADLAQNIESEEGLAEISRQLEALHQRILACPVRIIGAGEGEDGRRLAEAIDVPGADGFATRHGATAQADTPSLAQVALVAPAQVNHCFASWPTVRLGHPDAPTLAVLANLLTNGVLHQALREEGGAYGGRARYSPQSGVLTMLSYRDPRLAGTYRDFERAIDWVLETPLQREHIEEAIIGVIGELDRPQTPFHEAMQSWQMQLLGVTKEIRQAFRQGVLNCTEEALKMVARAYLKDRMPSRAAFAGNAEQDLAGLQPLDLLALVPQQHEE
ncbi:insulinase family protein [Noviherbaspirillum pedocola]|uniref:Insulinase family protein n=1 Tax=Noviherbaspirillum pedocola TaxID=2801341 RepID=A0A934T083_9BURK|nr:insulinase family protein [Noviherbaspirillum pedocola]MBK4738964.1 insulinase family protein [Noviherbaspirillum pedocola]